MNLGEFYKNKKIFVTGHTGFKGSWLCFFLNNLGAETYGYSLEPDNSYQSLYSLLNTNENYGFISKDIRDLSNLQGTNQLIKQIINAVNAIHQISRKGEVKLTNFWINISGKGSSNTPHTHSGLTYSGVFFIKVPKEMKGGRFLFYRNFNEADFISTEYMGHFKEGYQMQGYDYPINTISPKENMLVVFPAWVPHAVEINLSDEERISLSFNFKLNRTFSRVK